MGRNPPLPFHLPDLLLPPSALSPTAKSHLPGICSDYKLEESQLPKAASFPGCPSIWNSQGQRQGHHAMSTSKRYSWGKFISILLLAK